MIAAFSSPSSSPGCRCYSLRRALPRVGGVAVFCKEGGHQWAAVRIALAFALATVPDLGAEQRPGSMPSDNELHKYSQTLLTKSSVSIGSLRSRVVLHRLKWPFCTSASNGCGSVCYSDPTINVRGE